MRQLAQTLDMEVSLDAREKRQPVFDLDGRYPIGALQGAQSPPLAANSRIGAEVVGGRRVPEQADDGEGETCKTMYKHIESGGSVYQVGVDCWLKGRGEEDPGKSNSKCAPYLYLDFAAPGSKKGGWLRKHLPCRLSRRAPIQEWFRPVNMSS